MESLKLQEIRIWIMGCCFEKTGDFIGDCGLTIQNIDGDLLPEIGYHIHEKYWRRGFGSEAARAGKGLPSADILGRKKWESDWQNLRNN